MAETFGFLDQRGSLLTRSTALQWGFYNADYYRFEIYRSSLSTQHADLVQLAPAVSARDFTDPNNPLRLRRAQPSPWLEVLRSVATTVDHA